MVSLSKYIEEAEKLKTIKEIKADDHTSLFNSKVNKGAKKTSKFFIQCLGLNDVIRKLIFNDPKFFYYIISFMIN